MNYRLIAVKLGDQLKQTSSINEINRIAQAVFSFDVEEHQNDAITSQRAKMTYNWVMTLAEQEIPEKEKLDLLITFIKEIAPEFAQSNLLEESGTISTKGIDNEEISSFSRELFMLMPLHYPFEMHFELAIKPAVESLGYTISKANDNLKTGTVIEQIKDSIKRARLVVADVTERNPNVFYEMGLAHAYGKEVLILTQRTDDVPFDITHLRYFKYDLDNDFEGMKRKFYNVFKKNLE